MKKKIIYIFILLAAAVAGYLIRQKPTSAPPNSASVPVIDPERVVERPPMSLKAARKLIVGFGWTIDETPAPSVLTGCISASSREGKGKICFESCNGQSTSELSQKVGQTYGYHIGNPSACDMYTVILGDAKFRFVVTPY